MINHGSLESIYLKHDCCDFRWIDPKEIVVAQWVRMKCMFGCQRYGKCGCCPPNTPSVEECQSFFREYSQGVIFRFSEPLKDPDDRHEWSREINIRLSDIEREVFLAGYNKVFLLFMAPCSSCHNCGKGRQQCINPKFARPSPEGMAVDVFSTVRKYGYPIKVLQEFTETMNRYAFLLVE